MSWGGGTIWTLLDLAGTRRGNFLNSDVLLLLPQPDCRYSLLSDAFF